MEYRTLGRTGFQVSEIGYGSWGIGKSGWIGAKSEESLPALQKAIDLGLNFIDYRPRLRQWAYEQLVGQVVRDQSKRIYVSTKIPPKNGKWPARPGIPVEDDSRQLYYRMYRAQPAQPWNRCHRYPAVSCMAG